MIKDLLVSLVISTENDSARDYAITIAESFDADIVGMAFNYEYAYAILSHILGKIPAEVVTQAMLKRQKALAAVIDDFDATSKRSLLSAEHIVQ